MSVALTFCDSRTSETCRCEFGNGDFSVPMFVHSEIPPGVIEMKDRKGDIVYMFEEMPAGGRVRITTANRDALNAIHDFLIYQIRDHQTGDPEHP